jgi:putative DNA primase/helicase
MVGVPMPAEREAAATEHGFQDATTDAAVITSWWAATPWANIGVATEASCLAVLDVDPAGLRRYGRMRLPRTPMAITGRGGYHILFRAPEWRVSSGSDKYGNGLDVKAAGAYIVVAPSVHPSGNVYKWHRSSDDVALAGVAIPAAG